MDLSINLKDHFDDLNNITFADTELFWEAVYFTLIDNGITIDSEKDFLEALNDESKLEYLEVKKSNPDWEFPEFLDKQRHKEEKDEESS